jgi:hypothetical protein
MLQVITNKIINDLQSVRRESHSKYQEDMKKTSKTEGEEFYKVNIDEVLAFIVQFWRSRLDYNTVTYTKVMALQKTSI